ncbi:MAG: molybdopterin-synthase adenylyltransferase MoeB [Thiomargarita sp.]|nr:molybdopterin-synthase adenylyltransferase MoeB [Thiomargarita sp.]
MNDSQLLRYSRQILLPQIDVSGQQQLLNSKVLIIGVGGLGSPVSMYLATSGIGHLVLVDFDQVDLSNLQRQILYDTTQIGQEKIVAAKHKLQLLNPEIQITAINQQFDKKFADDLFNQVDVVVDCSDNFATRFALNATCVRLGVPLISGAALRWEGQVSVFLLNQANSPCYNCLYNDCEQETETCNEVGILAPLVGIIGSIQALEVIKVLLNMGQSLAGKLLRFDAYNNKWHQASLKQDPTCPVCNNTKSV